MVSVMLHRGVSGGFTLALFVSYAGAMESPLYHYDDGATALHQAAARGDVTVIMQELATKNDDAKRQAVNAPDKHGHTPLFFAAAFGKLGALDVLYAAGGDIQYKDYKGRTPLYSAARGFGGVEIVKFLIEHGACATVIDNDGMTPLHEISVPLTCEGADSTCEMADILLGAGADMRLPYQWGPSPLVTAACKGDDAYVVLEVYIKHGARVDEVVLYVPNCVDLAFHLKRTCADLLAQCPAWSVWVEKITALN